MRPETVADLTAADLRTEPMITIIMDAVPPNGALVRVIGMLMSVLTESGIPVTKEHGAILARPPLTEDKLAEKLRSAQAAWDYYQQQYNQSQSSGVEPTHKTGLVNWCTTEGLPLPWLCPCGKPSVGRDVTGSPVCADCRVFEQQVIEGFEGER